MSDIQDYIRHIIEKQEALSDNPVVHIYISRINKKLVFKIKDGCMIEFQTPETMKLFGSTKNR